MENSPFAKLSPEIRNHIYGYAIVNRPRLPKRDDSSIAKACQVNIARLCKQMRAECLPMCFAGIAGRIDIVECASDDFEVSQEEAELEEMSEEEQSDEEDEEFSDSDEVKDDNSVNDEGVGGEGVVGKEEADGEDLNDEDEDDDNESDEEPENTIQAAVNRLRVHPKVCYDGLDRLFIDTELHLEDLTFQEAWKKWEQDFTHLAEALDEHGLAPKRLEIEVVYSSDIGEQRLRRKFREAFNALGLHPKLTCNM